MAGTAVATRGGGGGVQRAPNPTGLAEGVDLILDKGLVIDVYVRVALVGIELLTIDARIVIASVDTYLRFAEAVNRLDLTQTATSGLPELMEDITEGGAKSKSKGALEGAKESLFGSDDDDDDDGGQEQEQRAKRRRSASGSSSGGSRRRRSSSSSGSSEGDDS